MNFKLALTIAVSLTLGACAHYSESIKGEPLSVDAVVTIYEDGPGNYSFAYKAPFFDENGNFDFSQKGAAFNRIKLTFSIDASSVAGLKFKTEATDAIWIVEKINVDPATGSPKGPYRGQQFNNFTVSADGRSLTLIDENNDGVLYRYGLRFDLDGKTVIHDPDGQNGGTYD